MTKSQINELLKKSKSKSKTKHTLKHTFQWPVPIELTKEDLKTLKLIKGVAMQEGQVKSGENMKRDNVIAGGGALRASSLLGFATLDIDHYDEKLPKEYTDEYPGLDVPCGFHVDAQTVENTVGKEQKKLMEVEFIAVLENEKAYELVKNNEFVGCSVVDYARSLNCAKCNGTDADASCGCDYDGSAYLHNTLVLKEVPNSNGTWVDIVTEEDIGTIIQTAKGTEKEKMNTQLNQKITPIQNKILNILGRKHTADKHEYQEADLTNYMTDGIWNNGKDSITAFLQEEKLLDESFAAEMAQYLFENPTKLTQYQLTDLSTDDLIAWWNTVAKMEKEIHAIKKKLATLSWLEHNAKPLRALEHTVPFGQAEVEYGERPAGSQCQDCRWYSSVNFADGESNDGWCQIVAGDVMGSYGCDRFEELPSGGGGSAAAEADPPMPEEAEDPDMNMDGEDGEEMPNEVMPDENGNCPDGYMLNEDGTMCIMVSNEEEEGEGEGMKATTPEQSIPVPNAIKNYYNFLPSSRRNQRIIKNALVEKNPQKRHDAQVQKLDSEINKLKQSKKRITLELKHSSQFNKSNQNKKKDLNRVTNEIQRLQNLKKKL